MRSVIQLSRVFPFLGALASCVAFAATAAAAPPRLELGPYAGAGIRHTRGHFDTELLDGYAYQFAAAVGLDARWFAGEHGVAWRGFVQRDLVLGAVHSEHMNAFGADLLYLFRAPLGASRRAGLVLGGGANLSRFDAVWDDGLRGFSCLFSSACFDRLRELRRTEESFDHTAVGPVLDVGLDARVGRLVVGGGIEQRLLFALGNDAKFVHHVALLQLRAAWAFGP